MSSATSTFAAQVYDYLQLCRASNFPTVWMNGIAGYVLSGGEAGAAEVTLFLVAITAMYGGGMAMNDCVDAPFDAVSKPARPVASGRVPVSLGVIAYTVLFTMSLAAFYGAGGISALAAGTILLALVIGYNLTHNRTPLSVLLMAGCRAMIYISAGISFAGVVNKPLFVLAVVQFLYIIVLTFVARHEKQKQKAPRNSEGIPLIPVMLAGIPIIDGMALAITSGLGWIAAGLVSGVTSLACQRKIKGD